MNNRTRLNRLYRLRAVVELHKGQRGKPVKLNGTERTFDMWNWDCGTGACALGSYALTPYGQRHFKWDGSTPLLRGATLSETDAAAAHFGISDGEAEFLFMPHQYGLNACTPVAPTKVIKHIDQIIRVYKKGEGHMQESR